MMADQAPWANRIVGHGTEDPAALADNPANWRRHPATQADALSGVVSEVGWVQSVIVNRTTGRLVDGHLRVRLARERGEASIPVVYVELSDDEERLVLATLDPLGAMAETDADALGALLADLQTDDDEIRRLVSFLATDAGLDARPVAEDPGPQIDRAEDLREKWRTERGQLWEIGRHRLLCGDSTSAEDVARLVAGDAVNLAVTSPPYAEQRTYDATSGFQPVQPESYVAWFRPVAANVARHLADDGSWVINIKAGADDLDTTLYVMDLVIAHVREWGWHFATEFCWERNGVPKAPTLRLKNQFEPVYQFARGRWKFRPENVRHASENMIVPLGEGAGDTSWDRHQGGGEFFKPEQVRHRRRRNGTTATMSNLQGTSVAPGEALTVGWAYPGNRLPTFAATHEALGHPAAFPVGLPSFFARLLTDPDDIVYDPFGGSGSSLVAAEQTERRARVMEISPAYCGVILERLAGMGLSPRLSDG